MTATVALAHDGAEGTDTVAFDPLERDRHIAQAECGRDVVEPGGRRTGIDQRGEQHVTGDPADAVEIRDAGHAREANRVVHC